MITSIKIDSYDMTIQHSISTQVDMDIYNIIVNNIKKQRTDFLVKIIQNQIEQVLKKCYNR
jgi:hypothetical protein